MPIILVGFVGFVLLVGCSQNYSDKKAGEALRENNFQQLKSQGEKTSKLEMEVSPYQGKGGSEGARQSLKGISVQMPPEWRSVPPSSSMRLAEYSLSGEAVKAEDASLAVFFFGPNQGGTIEANIDRWYGQFEQPDGGSTRERAKRWEKEVGDLSVTMVDIGGTYSGGMGPMGQSEAPKAGYRMLGGIAPAPAGLFFFKLIGPAPTIELWAESFEKYMGSIRSE